MQKNELSIGYEPKHVHWHNNQLYAIKEILLIPIKIDYKNNMKYPMTRSKGNNETMITW